MEKMRDDGKGITKKIADEFFVRYRCDTSGNHIWDKEEAIKYIGKN